MRPVRVRPVRDPEDNTPLGPPFHHDGGMLYDPIYDPEYGLIQSLENICDDDDGFSLKNPFKGKFGPLDMEFIPKPQYPFDDGKFDIKRLLPGELKIEGPLDPYRWFPPYGRP